jgi:hypothetical protein
MAARELALVMMLTPETMSYNSTPHYLVVRDKLPAEVERILAKMDGKFTEDDPAFLYQSGQDKLLMEYDRVVLPKLRELSLAGLATYAEGARVTVPPGQSITRVYMLCTGPEPDEE